MACRSACILPAAMVRKLPSWRSRLSWRRRNRGSIACRHCELPAAAMPEIRANRRRSSTLRWRIRTQFSAEIGFGSRLADGHRVPRHVGSAATPGHHDRVCVSRRWRRLEFEVGVPSAGPGSDQVAVNGLISLCSPYCQFIAPFPAIRRIATEPLRFNPSWARARNIMRRFGRARCGHFEDILQSDSPS